ncbi:MAG TPA: hypothetical protein VMW80_03155 [Candidatus Dormibacteraeota bacterium]|nr:hypothetical protein [Candidatus Dormibacteraeota bacterium]
MPKITYRGWERGLLLVAVLVFAAAALVWLRFSRIRGAYLGELGTAVGTLALALVTVAALIENRHLAQQAAIEAEKVRQHGRDLAEAERRLDWEPYLRVQDRAGSGGYGDSPEAPYRRVIGLRNVGNGPAIGVIYLCIHEENPDDWDWYMHGPIDLAAGEVLGEAWEEGLRGQPISLTNMVHDQPLPVDPNTLQIPPTGRPPRRTYVVLLCMDRFGRRLRFYPRWSALPDIKSDDDRLDEIDRWYDTVFRRQAGQSS